ncbi:hypothetical protein KORDIASMS9_01103 [Kordia sp. SMS9]|nr:hypothetical protein KORDIASMS9_01103 [Kordia sp. SMS9]
MRILTFKYVTVSLYCIAFYVFMKNKTDNYPHKCLIFNKNSYISNKLQYKYKQITDYLKHKAEIFCKMFKLWSVIWKEYMKK